MAYLKNEGQAGLPPGIFQLCQQLSASCPLAYVEAEFFGGAGAQAHVLFSSGQAISPAVVSDTAINEALQHIGVQKGQAADEFAAAGLGLHRNTDDWLE